MRAAVFDVMGTLFDLRPLRELLGPGALEAWFERTLHAAAVVTLTEAFRPFDEVAQASFEATAAKLGLDVEPQQVLEQLAKLPAYPDARPAFEILKSGDIRIAVLTNGGADNTRTLLESAGLLAYVEAIYTTADVQRYKPHPDVYRHAVDELGLAPQDATLIAAHGWDVIGAQHAHLQGIWVERLERRWPLPLPEPRRAETLEEAAEMVLETR